MLIVNMSQRGIEERGCVCVFACLCVFVKCSKTYIYYIIFGGLVVVVCRGVL